MPAFTRTGHVPARRARQGDYIRAIAWQGVGQARTEDELELALRRARDTVRSTVHEVSVRLVYGILWHREADVMRLGAYLLATDQVPLAVALLEAWDRNPHRAR